MPLPIFYIAMAMSVIGFFLVGWAVRSLPDNAVEAKQFLTAGLSLGALSIAIRLLFTLIL